MAEALVSFTAAGAGFVSLLVQITSGIKKLRGIQKSLENAPAELDYLLGDLDFLICLLKEVENRAPRGSDLGLRHCEASCNQVIQGLEAMNEKFESQSKINGRLSVLNLLSFLNWKDDIEALRRGIQAAKADLTLVNTYHISVYLEELSPAIQLFLTQSTNPRPSLGKSQPSQRPVLAGSCDSSCTILESTKKSTGIARRRPSYNGSCLTRLCSCVCHQTTKTAGRFWALEFTPLAAFRQTCDKESCDGAKYGWSFRLALSRLGIRWSAAIQFHILSESGKFSLRPCLDLERIVPYTSPGFEVLLRCQKYFMTINEARERLTELYRTDDSFVNHVDPSGKSYIEVLLAAPWRGNQEDQFCLLLLFMRDFQMKRGTKTASFLTQCARWIGEGRHLDLLETLIDLDLCVTELEVDSRSWPEPSSPNWISESVTPDPFFIDYIRILCLNNQGFAEMTPLHEAVLFGSSESLNKEISRSRKDVKNFLGQTPVHLAVCHPSHLRALLQAGHDSDAPDNYGITPLMYAAAMNEEESLMMLLEFTIKPSASCRRFQRTFVDYAAAHRHWKLILKVLCRIEIIAGKQIAEKWAEAATIRFQVTSRHCHNRRDVSLHELLAKCGSPDFTFDDGTCGVQNNCLLHEAKTVADVEAILSSGSKLINHTNSAGQHPLMAAAKRHNPEMVRKLLDAGADVSLKDNKHRTSLDHALKTLDAPFFDVVEPILDTVRIVLSSGADVFSRDCCRCPCSPQGCLPTSVLPYSVSDLGDFTRFPIWTAEWLNLVHEYRSLNEAKATLLSLIRRLKHEKLGMTHVCCRRQERNQFLFYDQVQDDEIDGIVEEESEFVELLEREMGEIAECQYEALLELWIREMKVSFDEVCKNHAERKQKWPSTYGPRTKFDVDYHNDRFIGVFSMGIGRDPTEYLISAISEYITWLEGEYKCREFFHLEGASREDWYLRRQSLVQQIINTMQVSVGDLANAMRKLVARDDSNVRTDVEGALCHFFGEPQIPLQ